MLAELIPDVQVWRAATRVDAAELQPTGPRQIGRAALIFQEQMETGPWRQLLATHVPSATAESFLGRNWQRLSGACCRTLLLIADVLFEVVPGILSGTGGYDISAKDG